MLQSLKQWAVVVFNACALGCVGPTGTPGEAGPQGAQGETGQPGPQGPQGPAGTVGPAGAQGSTGMVGQKALVRLEVEAAGGNCSAGGTVVLSGLDADGDGQLGATEVSATRYVCNGTPQVASCANAGEILKWDGSNWGCAAEATYSAGTGLELNGRTLSLSTACNSGEVLKWNGSAWACQQDNASVSASSPLTGSGSPSAPLTVSQQSISPELLVRGGVVTDLARGTPVSVSGGTVTGQGPTSEMGAEGSWSTNVFPSTMTLDLGGQIEGVSLLSFESFLRGDPRYIPAYSGAGAYSLEHSPDGTTWTLVPTVAPVAGDVFAHPIAAQTTFRYLRLTVRAPQQAGNAVRISTFRVLSPTYGDSTRIDARRLYNGVRHDGANFSVSGTFQFKGPSVGSPVFGGGGGNEFGWDCPAGYVVTGVRGRAGGLVDQLWVVCTRL